MWEGFPFLAEVLPENPHWQVPLQGDAGAVPAQTPYKKVALEKVSVFLMPPLYSTCAPSTTAITKLGETASDSPCTLSRALKKLLRSEKKKLKT